MKKFGWTVWGILGLVFAPVGFIFLPIGLMAGSFHSIRDSGDMAMFKYKYLTWYLTGKMGYEQMVEELGNATKRFAKRQMTWFRKDPRIIWLDMAADPISQARPYIQEFLSTLFPNSYPFLQNMIYL